MHERQMLLVVPFGSSSRPWFETLAGPYQLEEGMALCSPPLLSCTGCSPCSLSRLASVLRYTPLPAWRGRPGHAQQSPRALQKVHVPPYWCPLSWLLWLIQWHISYLYPYALILYMLGRIEFWLKYLSV
jgi:hypothetical protein